MSQARHFLEQFPPFYHLPRTQLDPLLAQLEERLLQPEQTLFQEGAAPADWIYVLKSGQLELWQNRHSGAQLLELCAPGEVLGCRAALSQQAYALTARSRGESRVYALPATAFLSAVSTQAPALLFLAQGFAAGKAVLRENDPIGAQPPPRISTPLSPFALRVVYAHRRCARPPAGQRDCHLRP